jgi:hydrogenase expression/formation protein HypE
MSVLPEGKIPVDLLSSLLAAFSPAPPEVVLGPRIGEDACAIEVDGEVLVAATDPITPTGERLGELAVLVNANDVAVMGVRPRWFLAVVLLPSGTDENAVQPLFEGIRRGLARVRADLVGGHTEVTQAVTQPIVVGQMLGLAEEGRFVRTGGGILQVGPAPIEGAAVLAHESARA